MNTVRVLGLICGYMQIVLGVVNSIAALFVAAPDFGYNDRGMLHLICGIALLTVIKVKE